MALVTVVFNGHSDDLSVLRNNEVVAGVIQTHDGWEVIGRGVPRPIAGGVQALAGGVVEFDQKKDIPKRYRKFKTFETLEAALLALYSSEKDADVAECAERARNGAKRLMKHFRVAKPL